MTAASAKRKCFVISPIGEEKSPERVAADKVLKHIIKKGLGSDYDISRADDSANPGAITPNIVASILEADLIVADLSGLNANVFYELAIAHGYGKPTVHIQRAGERPPFDVKDMRIVRYEIADPDDVEASQQQLAKAASFAEVNPSKVETPLTSARRFESVQSSEDPVAESNVQVMNAINELTTYVKRAVGSRRPRTTPDDRILEKEAELSSLKKMINRIVRSGRALESDFEGLITQLTSGPYDTWITAHLSEILNTDEEATLYSVLYDEELQASWHEPENYEPDEDLRRGR